MNGLATRPSFPPSPQRFIKTGNIWSVYFRLVCLWRRRTHAARRDNHVTPNFFQQIRSLLTTFLIKINGYNVGENLHQKACIIRTALHRGKRVQDSGQCPIFSYSHCFWEDLPIASFRLKTGRLQGTSRKQSVWEKGNAFISSLCSSCVCIVYA